MHLKLEVTPIMDLRVNIGEHQEIGDSAQGFLKVIPITGGAFSGPKIKGKVVPGGADWNTLLGGSVRHIFAKYTLLTDDGEYISIENEGYAENTDIQPEIRTVPRFIVSDESNYTFLRSGVFVGSLKKGSSDFVSIRIYKMK